ncbi:MAG: ABC-F family ATP-binding cassette domain-containing protein, partial [Deltaproteobacteria bacterium]|nr:ABC-F family ATP-binding cassette domain-containing protein [Deltaproteobacteria bacterium]
RTLLGAFRFSGNDVDKTVACLSGGEKSRLALARLLIRPANLLLMDEPTNHLDIESREVLEEALRQYEGTLLFTSHDRRFIDAVATRTLELERGVLSDFPGNYSYYQWKKGELEAATPPPEQAPAAEATAPVAGGDPRRRDQEKDRKRREAEFRQALHRELGPSKKRLEELEGSIQAAEQGLAEVEASLADPATYGDPERSRALSHHHGDLIATLNHAMAEWETLSEDYESRKARLTAEFGMSE